MLPHNVHRSLDLSTEEVIQRVQILAVVRTKLQDVLDLCVKIIPCEDSTTVDRNRHECTEPTSTVRLDGTTCSGRQSRTVIRHWNTSVVYPDSWPGSCRSPFRHQLRARFGQAHLVANHLDFRTHRRRYCVLDWCSSEPYRPATHRPPPLLLSCTQAVVAQPFASPRLRHFQPRPRARLAYSARIRRRYVPVQLAHFPVA